MLKSYVTSFASLVNSVEITGKDRLQIDNDKGFSNLCDLVGNIKKQNGTVYLVGNGGSNAIISHCAIDLVNACKIKAYPLTDSSQITCLSNDFGYEKGFSKALELLMSENDLLIAVSSSGKSQNILNACATASEKRASVVTLSGFSPENSLRNLGSLNLWLNSSDYGMVEIGHSLLLHHLTDLLKDKN